MDKLTCDFCKGDVEVLKEYHSYSNKSEVKVKCNKCGSTHILKVNNEYYLTEEIKRG